MAMALAKLGLCLVLVMKAAEAFWGVKTSPPHPGPVPSPEKFYPYLPMSQEVWEAYHRGYHTKVRGCIVNLIKLIT